MDGARMTKTVVAALLLSLGASTALGAKPARRASSAPSAPLISVTSPVPEDRAAETRLMLFIKALQLDQRQKAARMLSRRVSAAERAALIRKRWLRRQPAARPGPRSEFAQVLFIPDLQIRTERLFRDARTLVVLPRTKRKKGLTGAIRVTMRKESGEWRVELHPESPLARR
jgi:hypothetical protein